MPLRWPTVKCWCPPWVPTTSPDVVTSCPSRIRSGVVLVVHKADLLRVGLVEHGELQFLGQRPHLVLLEAPDRQQRVLDRLAAHAEQDVALVLAVVAAAHQHLGAAPRINA